MLFRATVFMLLILVMVLLFSCADNNSSGSDNAVTYRITYNGNGNTGGEAPEFQTKKKGISLALSGNNGKLEKSGYTFAGWNTDANGGGTNYAAGAIYTAEASLILYAKWNVASSGSWIVSGNTLTDPDGNVYTTVKIGSQLWTVQNLKSTKYNDGAPIPNVTDNSKWANCTTDAFCYYDNDIANKAKYGGLYNWHAVNTGKLAPAGWHVPTDGDWDTLMNYLIANGYNYDGTTSGNKIAKSMAAQTDWKSSTKVGAVGNDLSKNNTSGFSGLPGGGRQSSGPFCYLGVSNRWWSTTEYIACCVYTRTIDTIKLYREDSNKGSGHSVRLVRDN